FVRQLGSDRNAIGYRSVTFLRQKLSKMERYRAAQGSNDFSCTMHALVAGPAGKLQFTGFAIIKRMF
ncbi:MAG: hypothetical protein UHS47_07635, partial [Oscillospiraceae bacterium]|nr:hypothetical protein [Oscillospiraceae bacterium]